MSSRHIRAFCELSADCERLIERAMTQQGPSARAHDRILKVARTIADLEDVPHLGPKHIAEAIQYRSRTGHTGPKEFGRKEFVAFGTEAAKRRKNKAHGASRGS